MNTAQFATHARIEEEHWWFRGRRRILRDLVSSVIPPFAGGRLIDVGCGTGADIASLSDAYDCQGIDPSQEGIEHARRRFPDVTFSCGLAPGAVVDEIGRTHLLMMCDVLEHIEDDAGTLRSLVVAMPVGSHLLLTVPADMHLWSMQDVNYGHYRRYDLQMFSRVWRDLPVQQRLLSYFNSNLYPVIRLIRSVTQLTGRTYGDGGTDLKLPSPQVNRVLEEVLASEGRALKAALKGTGTSRFGAGVSIAAVLTKVDGEGTTCSA